MTESSFCVCLYKTLALPHDQWGWAPFVFHVWTFHALGEEKGSQA